MTPQIQSLVPAPREVLLIPPIPGPRRHPMIFGAFGALAPGEFLVIVNDHDPRPLRAQFEARCAGTFEWSYLETGPERWQVRIARTAAGAAGPAAPSGGCHAQGSAAPAPPAAWRPADLARFRPEAFLPNVLAQTPSMKVVLACFEPGQFIPVHSPGIDLALYVIEGEAICQVGKEERRVGAGDLVWVPAGEPRGVKATTRVKALHLVAPPPTEADHRDVRAGLERGSWRG